MGVGVVGGCPSTFYEYEYNEGGGNLEIQTCEQTNPGVWDCASTTSPHIFCSQKRALRCKLYCLYILMLPTNILLSGFEPY